MNLTFSIARRYLISHKSTNAINFLSAISVIGMALVSMSLVIVLSVFNGFEGLVISLYNSFYPSILVTSQNGKTFEESIIDKSRIVEIPGVLAISGVLEENALLRYKDKEYFATIKGVDREYKEVSGLDSTIYRGDYILEEGGIDYAVLGAGIEYSLSVSMVGATPISIYVPKMGNVSVLRPDQAFNRKNVYPGGVFAIQRDFDMKYMIVSLAFAQDLLEKEGTLSALEISMKDEDFVPEAKEALQALLGKDFRIQDRFEQNALLYQIMKLEKWAVYLILTFILLIVTFNILGSLSMLVIEKKRDIAILKTMGATSRMITRIFLLDGMLMAIVGGAGGILLGLLVCFLQIEFKLVLLDPNSTFVIDAYPIIVVWTDILAVFITVFVIAWLATLYPAIKAGKQLSFVKEA